MQGDAVSASQSVRGSTVSATLASNVKRTTKCTTTKQWLGSAQVAKGDECGAYASGAQSVRSDDCGASCSAAESVKESMSSGIPTPSPTKHGCLGGAGVVWRLLTGGFHFVGCSAASASACLRTPDGGCQMGDSSKRAFTRVSIALDPDSIAITCPWV